MNVMRTKSLINIANSVHIWGLMHNKSHPLMKSQKVLKISPPTCMYCTSILCRYQFIFLHAHRVKLHLPFPLTPNNYKNNWDDSWYFIRTFLSLIDISRQPTTIYISSLQSWNRYSPLPQPAQSGFTTRSPSSLSSGSLTEPKTVVPPDPYSNLPPDSRRVVDSVASMGFPKAQAARAVEKLGADQKEVI